MVCVGVALGGRGQKTPSGEWYLGRGGGGKSLARSGTERPCGCSTVSKNGHGCKWKREAAGVESDGAVQKLRIPSLNLHTIGSWLRILFKKVTA